MDLFFSFIISMLITMALIPLLMKSAEKYQFVDHPGPRKVHVKRIPRIGGIAMVAGTVFPIALWLLPQREVAGFLAGLVVIVAFGIWDDRRGLNYKAKFLGQIIAVLTVIFYGHVLIQSVPLLSDAEQLPAYLSVPLTLLFILGITNAINLSDGLDGLAGGTTLLSIGAMAILGYVTDNVMVVLISVAVVGSILGFLRFNTHPAQIFMGDGGSQFLGFSVGVLAVLLVQNGSTRISPALPLLLMALPILDTLMVMSQRIREGRSPFEADKSHIHHRLLVIGFSHYEAVLLIYVLQAALVVTAYLLRFQHDGIILSVLSAVFVSLWGILYFAQSAGWRISRDGRSHSRYKALRSGMMHLRDRGYPLKVASGLAAVIVVGYLMAAVLTSGKVTKDIGVLSLGVFLVMVIHVTRHWKSPISWADQGGMYVLGTLAIFMAQTTSQLLVQWKPEVDGFFVLLAIIVLMGFIFSKQKHFELTTLDFLVIFAACTIPNLPHVTIGQTSLGECVAKLIILFYGTELLLLNIRKYVYVLRPLVLTMFLVIGLRAIT